MVPQQSKKRLVVCCDGTWNDSVSTDNPLTNVSRLSRCVEEIAEDGILQVVYYHTGVGSGTSKLSNSVDGATGRGLSANIRDAYSFICNNYNFKDGNDEIFLVGFSRGAFTVRCIASLIEDIGLLTKRGLANLHALYDSWNSKSKDAIQLELETGQLERKGVLKRHIQIEACAVWDTVSALGVPIPFGLPQPASKKLAFVDTKIPKVVRNAFHALALHERRKHFEPLLWDHPREQNVNFRQCWFFGSHSDVGGGYEDAGLANLTLIWMIAQFQTFTTLCFSMETLLHFLAPDQQIEQEKSWSFGSHTSYEWERSYSTIRSKIDEGALHLSHGHAFLSSF
ncbi:uncharacterized protein BDR25DRAFT_377820 [Lindgomyces ingoldianus]|uniref:Uncharacterized protein n=1 Tax=Lindgomyces ingoldianus TaxID=673940 RepID=A0ACB6QGL2_9PLEO|nr:uncharacterized protein BDR25DRAFT_377820 [Lindgomyces ingoldianus]KAF2466113.1 hypothetical protein BDR25DRAFT_377820 [Lindgomyces ingoldianus]